MKYMKRIGKLLLVVLGFFFVFLLTTTVYHHVTGAQNAKDIVPNGNLVEIDDYKIHIYTEGEKNDKPTLVFLSGSATVSPVYNFKALYRILSDEYRIAVVEKAGYGYSDIVETDRDLETILNEVRLGLKLIGEKGPYVLIPHSMSGLEAIYWTQQYPEEIEAIIGLDMAVPESYEKFDFLGNNRRMKLGRISIWLGVHRIPGFYSLDQTALTEHEIHQQKLLMHRNAVNIDYVLEVKALRDNITTLKGKSVSRLPMLMFLSDGKEIGKDWIDSQKKFASENNAQLFQLDCGHYIHNYEYEYISEKIIDFLQKH